MNIPTYNEDQVSELTTIVTSAFRYAELREPNTRQHFAWLVATHMIGGLSQCRAITPDIIREYHRLTNHYGQTSIRREVKNK